MTEEQIAKLTKVMAAQQKLNANPKSGHFVDIRVGGEIRLYVPPGVCSPDVLSMGRHVDWYFQEHPEFVKGKWVTDMGTGCGLVGISAWEHGAEGVYLADNHLQAALCASSNVARVRKHAGIKCLTLYSNLFTSFVSKGKWHCQRSDVLAITLPWYVPGAKQTSATEQSFRGEEGLLERCLRAAPRHLNPGATCIIPWPEPSTGGNELEKLVAACDYRLVCVCRSEALLPGTREEEVYLYVITR